MFYAHQILHRRRGKFGLLWLAATSPKKIKNSSLLSVSLSDLAEELARSLSRGRLLPGALYSERYSLRLSAKLLTGLWVLYRKKAAALRAKAEECLRLLTTRKRPRDQDVDLPEKKGEKRRRKGSPVPPLTAGAEPPSAHFGKVLSKEETPEELIVERLPPVPADTLTADRERITLREEVPLRLDPLALEDNLFQQEEGVPAEGDDFLEELERLMALRDDGGRARREEQQEAQQGEGRPLSPIARRSSRGGTPPPLRPPSDSAAQEVAGELVAEPRPEPPFEAVVEETPEGEPLPAVVVDPGLPAAASEPGAEPVAEPDAEAAAVPPAPPAEQQPPEEAVAGPSGLSPPSRRSPRRGGRRRPAASPPAGPAPRRRRRGPIVDRLTQLSMEEMRENMRANNLRGRPAAFQSLAQLLHGPDVDALFRLPGRRLLSERLLRPWKLAQTRPEPDWEEEQEEEGEEPAGGEAGVQPQEEVAPPAGEGRRRQEAEGQGEPREEPVPAAPAGDGEDGSLEAGREPSASSSGLETGLAGRPSVASLLADIQEEEPAEQQPQHPDGGVVTAEPLVGVGGDLVPVPEEEEGPLEQEEPLPREGGAAALPGDHLAPGASPGGPAGAAVMGAASSEGAVAASPSVQPEEPSGGRLGSLWSRLQEVKDAHGMCTLEALVPPDAFNRRSVAASFATLLRMHKRGMVQLEQFSAYGPVVVTVSEEEEQGTPPVDRPHP